MNRIEVHDHFLPGLDDGCRNMDESLEALRIMVAHGYNRIFCTPHYGTWEFTDLNTREVQARLELLQQRVAQEKIPLELRAGGELRLTVEMPELLRARGIPSYALAGRYCLVDIWDQDWPSWAERGVKWLQDQGLVVIMAHPERMPPLRRNPDLIDQLAKLGLLFQGNLGPLGGHDAPDIVALSERYLRENRYFMLGVDGHRPADLARRLMGLQRCQELVGAAKLEELTVIHPGKIWDASGGVAAA